MNTKSFVSGIVRPKCKNCNNISYIKDFCPKHYKIERLRLYAEKKNALRDEILKEYDESIKRFKGAVTPNSLFWKEQRKWLEDITNKLIHK